MNPEREKNRLLFFGTCAGTEPMAGRNHASFAIETEKEVLWFDAGEGCSRTAHLMGVDLMKVRNVFISHTHMDHIGGLGNLLWNIRKLDQVRKSGRREALNVYMPEPACWESIYRMLQFTEDHFRTAYPVRGLPVQDGLLYETEECRVTARHNRHLGEADERGVWHSFSYEIRLGAVTVVYSGDVKSTDDLEALMEAGCDYLIMETGHHRAETVAAFAAKKGVKHLLFFHNGRQILEGEEQVRAALDAAYGGWYHICRDGDVIALE